MANSPNKKPINFINSLGISLFKNTKSLEVVQSDFEGLLKFKSDKYRIEKKIKVLLMNDINPPEIIYINLLF